MAASRRLSVATCQFAVGRDVRLNAAAIRRQMRTAARRGAELVHFSEAALSGYAGASFPDFHGYPWDTLAEETARIRDLAAELGLWTILGSAHPGRRGKPPYNCLYLIGPSGRIVKRYDKCFLTGRDANHYEAGQRVLTHTIGGIKCGFLICFDFRFPEIWREYLKRRCRVVFFSSYQTAPRRNRLMEQVAPATLATRASENFFYVVANNSSGGRQWYNTRVQLPQGDIARQGPWNRPAVVTYTIDLANDKEFYNAVGPLALRAVHGTLHT